MDEPWEMPFVPYRRVTLNSSLGPPELARRVAAVTQCRYRWFRFPPADMQFVGSVSENRLRLVPVIRGRNTYAPWELAEVRPAASGSTVDVQMTLHPVALALLLGFALAGFFISRAGGTLNWWFLAAFGAFHIVMYYIGFKPETRRVESLLRDLVK